MPQRWSSQRGRHVMAEMFSNAGHLELADLRLHPDGAGACRARRRSCSGSGCCGAAGRAGVVCDPAYLADRSLLMFAVFAVAACRCGDILPAARLRQRKQPVLLNTRTDALVGHVFTLESRSSTDRARCGSTDTIWRVVRPRCAGRQPGQDRAEPTAPAVTVAAASSATLRQLAPALGETVERQAAFRAAPSRPGQPIAIRRARVRPGRPRAVRISRVCRMVGEASSQAVRKRARGQRRSSRSSQTIRKAPAPAR